MNNSNNQIETIQKIYLHGNQGYLFLRPHPDDPSFFELCTEPGEKSQGFFGNLSLVIANADDARALAIALNRAADIMDNN